MTNESAVDAYFVALMDSLDGEFPKQCLSSKVQPQFGRPNWSEGMRKALEALEETEAGTPRFTAEYSTDSSPALHGATTLMPDGLTRSMKDEFCNNDGGKWYKLYHYVVFEAAVEEVHQVFPLAPLHTRDLGHKGMRLADFADTPRARSANLMQSEIAAIRLYTSVWFYTVNTALRTRDTVQQWATTVSLLTSAIIKLSRLSPTDQYLYRSLPAEFPAAESFSGSTENESMLDLAFMSCSQDVEYCAAYNGSKHTEGTLLVIQTTFSSRAADISSFSQYPEQKEWTFPPCTTLHFTEVVRLPTLPKYIALTRASVCMMRHYTDGLRFPWSSPIDPLSHSEYDLTLEAEREKARDTEGGVGSVEGKFAGGVRELVTGDPKKAALGLEDYMGVDLAGALGAHGSETSRVNAIVAEFEADGDEDLKWWLNYVLHQPASSETMRWGDRDKAPDRDGMRLDDFKNHDKAKNSNLQIEHVLALRLYTCTPVSFRLNNPLRDFKLDAETGKVLTPVSMREKHPFPVTIFLVHEAIKKLREAEGDAAVTLWRGVKDMSVPRDFLRAGGVEMAPMSTTYDLKTALFYSHSAHSVIFKIVTNCFMERGADVAWLSAFPGERECLFPPLTFLSPTGHVQEVGDTFTIVEVTPRM